MSDIKSTENNILSKTKHRYSVEKGQSGTVASGDLSLTGFTDMTPDSFRKWLYTVAHNQCIKQTQEKFKEFKPFSQVFPDDEKGIYGEPCRTIEDDDFEADDDIMVRLPEGDADYETSHNRAEEILSQLSLEEQELMRLLSQGKSYKEIQKHPWFKKYSIDYLKHKVHNIRQKVYKLSARGETSPKGGQKRKKDK